MQTKNEILVKFAKLFPASSLALAAMVTFTPAHADGGVVNR